MLIDFTPPISSEKQNILPPVPLDTLTCVFARAVRDVPPLIVSPFWNAPVSVDNLLTTYLFLSESIFKIVAVAFEVVPVTTSPT